MKQFKVKGNIQQIERSGQAFRINPYKLDNNKYVILSNDLICFAIQADKTFIQVSCKPSDVEYFKQYFDYNTNYDVFKRRILETKPRDYFVLKALKHGFGIRILKQDIFETIITFIISQRMAIPRIKQLVELLALNYGHKIDLGFYSFPSPMELSKATKSDLDILGFGYRSEYIIEATKFFCANTKYDIDSYFSTDRYNKLISFKGIGPKVANCIDLYAFHNMNAYPIDTHIQTMIDNVYNGYFDDTIYDGFQGYVQLLQFYYYMSLNKKDRYTKQTKITNLF